MHTPSNTHPEAHRLVEQARTLPRIPEEGVQGYSRNEPQLIREVNEKMSSRPDIEQLIGGNDLRIMFDNHRNHAAFMGFIFKYGEYESLARSLPWVYRAYTSQGFDPQYFPQALGAWMEAVQKNVASNQEILKVYEWIRSSHESIIRASRAEPGQSVKVPGKWTELQKEFLQSLLRGEPKDSLEIAHQAVIDASTLKGFMLQVIQPSMYEIGAMWESGEISVAREHLASSVVSTVLSSLYATTELPGSEKGHVLVAATSNEYHELGAWILSIMLEISGWHVSYLGANMPISDLVRFTLETEPDILALSVALVFNLENSEEIIRQIKDQNKNIKIILGGMACSQLSWACRGMRADYIISSAEQGLKTMEKIWKEKQKLS
jgi:methanogenic corrinoid protein MtbC1